MDSPRWTQLLLELSPGLVVGAAAAAGLVYFALGPWRRADRSALRRGGSALLPGVLIAFFYWCLEPVIDGLRRVGIAPRHVTLASLYLAGLAGVAIATGHLLVGVWFFGLAAAADGLDGALARRGGTSSGAGAFLDSFVDRVSEAAVFAGLAWYGAGGALTWVAFVAVISSILVSYARARGESLGVRGDVGLMQRPERLILLVLTLMLAPVAAVFLEPDAATPVYHVAIVGVGLVAVLSSITAFRRARWIYMRLQDEHTPVEPDATAPAEAAEGDASTTG